MPSFAASLTIEAHSSTDVAIARVFATGELVG
jgi:hypothetical protein